MKSRCTRQVATAKLLQRHRPKADALLARAVFERKSLNIEIIPKGLHTKAERDETGDCCAKPMVLLVGRMAALAATVAGGCVHVQPASLVNIRAGMSAAAHPRSTPVPDHTELYDWRTNSFQAGPPMYEDEQARRTATLLPNGKVLVQGARDWFSGSVTNQSLV